MPWKAKDSAKHTRKAKSKKAKRMWSKVANAVLKGGGSEGSAVRIANSAVKKARRKKK